MLQDSVWADTKRLADKGYQDTTVKFLTATFKGWVYCRDNPSACRDLVVAKGSKLGASHQLWQTNEVNKLVWPSPGGIGLVDPGAWKRTVDQSLRTRNQDGKTVLTRQPDGSAHTTDYARKALDALKGQGVDVVGEGFKPLTVTLHPGGA
jgi:NitT/TauT family transport system substrate-binding protein